jgi:methionyl-tRNA formyltransferase
VIRPPAQPERLVFLGTPAAAVPPLRALVDAGWPVDLVVSRADKRRRRNKPPEPSPVKAAALELGLTVTDRLEDVLSTDADLGVVVAYGRIIPTDLLERLPMVNVHFSLLPRWRGAAPVERAILADDRETGVCVMQVAPELDAGAVYSRVAVPVGSDPLSALRDRLVDEGTDLLTRTLAEGLGPPEPQVGEVTYAEKIEPDDLRLDWSASGEEVGRLVRLERAWTMFRGDRLRVLEVERVTAPGLAPGALDGPVVGTHDGAVRLVRVQPAGRGAMGGADWARGARPADGERFDQGGPGDG